MRGVAFGPGPERGHRATACRGARPDRSDVRTHGHRTYTVFGGVLSSEVALDGLPPAPPGARPEWVFTVGGAGVRSAGGRRIGMERLTSSLTATSYELADGSVRLVYDGLGIGEFWISADGRRLRWTPGRTPPLAHLRWILLGRVMALAMYRSGRVCLHGSGVAIGHGVVGFVAPKSYGKSTLAAALVSAGAALAADDVLPIEVGHSIQAVPGVPALRLRDPAPTVRRLGARCSPAGSGKTSVEALPDRCVVQRPLPLRAIYELAPVDREPAPGAAVAVEPVSRVAAFQAVARHASIARLLDSRTAPVLIDSAASIVRRVPVYRLRVVRDLRRLGDVTAWLIARHAGDDVDRDTPAGLDHAN